MQFINAVADRLGRLDSETIGIVLVVAAGLLALWLGFLLLKWTLAGALLILGFAGIQGFLGLAAYIACWVFLFPIMLTASVIVGFFAAMGHRAEKRQERAENLLAQRPNPNVVSREEFDARQIRLESDPSERRRQLMAIAEREMERRRRTES